MISSMDLFFRRDCAGGGGPAGEAPRVAFVPLVSLEVFVVATGAVDCKVVEGAADEVILPNKFDVCGGAEDAAFPLVPVMEVGSFVELVLLGVGLLRSEKIPAPVAGEVVPKASLFAPREPNKLGVILAVCEESIEIMESGLDRPSELSLREGNMKNTYWRLAYPDQWPMTDFPP